MYSREICFEEDIQCFHSSSTPRVVFRFENCTGYYELLLNHEDMELKREQEESSALQCTPRTNREVAGFIGIKRRKIELVM